MEINLKKIKPKKPKKEERSNRGAGSEPQWSGGTPPYPYGYGYRGMPFGGGHCDDSTSETDKLVEEIVNLIPKVVPAISDDYSTWLANGSRAYVDGNKVEVASAECSIDTFDLLIQEKANEFILNRVIKRLVRRRSGIKNISLYKNNVDIGAAIEDEATYGSHHNYSYLAEKRARIFSILRSFLPVALPLSGSGHIAPMANGKRVYCFSQRAFHITNIESEDTTVDRSLINTRKDFGPTTQSGIQRRKSSISRLHFIAYDATRCEFQTWLVSSIMHLVLRLAEEDWQMPAKLKLLHPLGELHDLNSCIDLNHQVKTSSGRIDVIEYNRIFLAAAKKLKPLSAMEKKCLKEWARVLNLLKAGAWKKLVGKLDWATKLWLLKIKMKQYGFGLDDPRAWKIAMNYHNISSSPRQSWFACLDKRGYIRHLIGKKDILRALNNPPDTRAKPRGELIKWFLRERNARELLIDFAWYYAKVDDGSDSSQTREIYFGEPNNPFSPNSDSLEKFIKNQQHGNDRRPSKR